MGLPVELGDVPGWISAGTGIANLLRGLSKRQQTQARNWGEMLDELNDREPEELGRIVQDNPGIAEVVGLAAEEAARTASEHKRYLLAQVAAAALRGTTTPRQVEALQYLTRTVSALSPADLTLLVTIGTTATGEPRPTEQFTVREDEEDKDSYTRSVTVPSWKVATRWPGPRELLNPALASLEQVGVIERRTVYLGGGAAGWALSGYGELFLEYLLTDLGGWPPRRQLEGG